MKINRFIVFAVSLLTGAAFTACQETHEMEVSLEVSPSSPIMLQAAGNAPVSLTVNTNAKEWQYSVPEWLSAEKNANVLVLTAEDNTSPEERSGKVEISASGTNPVVIPVLQAAGDGEVPSEDKGYLEDVAQEGDNIRLSVSPTSDHTAEIHIRLASPAEKDMEFEVKVDPGYVEVYKYKYMVSCELFPESMLEFSDAGILKVQKGDTLSAPASISMKVSDPSVKTASNYLIPLVVKSSDGINFTNTDRVNYLLRKETAKKLRNVLYFEVNDTNPLNALEFLLEDGTPFFDDIVIFASNVVYKDGSVQIWNNPNNQALLDEADVYLQPLREKGMKVHLGLLGHHTPAGLCQLSQWGAEMFAQEVADLVYEYRLDGVALDDEYSKAPDLSSPWFTNPSTASGCQLCYELKKAMTAKCPWETKVGVYQYNGFQSLTYAKDADTGEEVGPGQFVDFWVADYNGSGHTDPIKDMSIEQCSGRSVNLRSAGYILEEHITEILEKGYGHLMWFALDPSVYDSAIPYFQLVSEMCYGQELQEVKGYYKKIGEGEYDSEFYPFN